MNSNLFIPAQMDLLLDSVLSRTVGEYRGYLADIPPPPPQCSDPAVELRARLYEAIQIIEAELWDRASRRGATRRQLALMDVANV